ncbi:LAMI_0E15104g1_1 [Lachancea mirantina]|uniref:mitogen-activated protein kinase kinase n=1 Tax=Lachancea mirantina TaxID=1230905 RepID=A0A1G4JS30_9SACH|nr:LAMI_0E15104g1_1 [Lachancea mirantina]
MAQEPSRLFQPSSLKRKNLKHLTLGAGKRGSKGETFGSFVESNSARIQPRVYVSSLQTGPTIESPRDQHMVIQPSPTVSDMSSAGVTPTEDLIGLASDLERLTLLQNHGIQLEDLVQLGKIGSGNSGTVIKALHVPDSRVIAKKTIPIENKEAIKNQLLRELSIMHSVKPHANIVEFYGAFYTPSSSNEIVILMEYMDCGSLDKILATCKRSMPRENGAHTNQTWFNELSISRISSAVLQGLSYLYQDYKIIHRDIKPSNVLISSKGNVKICDFGVSRKLINSIADTFVGTSTYMSPERIQGNVYSTKGDVWSLGLMIIELLTGEFPLGGHKDTPEGILDLLQRIVNEPPPRLASTGQFSKVIVDFVNRCCVKDERERSSLQELMCHDFILMGKSLEDREFRHWCKRIKRKIKEDKMVLREEQEKAKLVKRQLESAANAAAAARFNR